MVIRAANVQRNRYNATAGNLSEDLILTGMSRGFGRQWAQAALDRGTASLPQLETSPR